MIIIEFICKVICKIYFKVARFVVWIITARDCKHCKHRKYNWWYKCYCCESNYTPFIDECMESVYRKNFERL